jgi:hypothetical protein
MKQQAKLNVCVTKTDRLVGAVPRNYSDIRKSLDALLLFAVFADTYSKFHKLAEDSLAVAII